MEKNQCTVMFALVAAATLVGVAVAVRGVVEHEIPKMFHFDECPKTVTGGCFGMSMKN